MAYTKTTFVNGQAPAVSAEELNKLGTGVEDAHNLASKADSIVPYGFTKDPTNLQDYQIWKRTDFPTDEFRMYHNGQKYKVNMTNLIGNTPLPNHYEGYIYREGSKNVSFTDYHNNNSSGTSSSPQNKTLVSWGASYLQLSMGVGDFDTTQPTNDVYVATTSSYDFSAIKSVEIDWEGTSDANDTDFPMYISIGNPNSGNPGWENRLSYTTTFSRRTSVINTSTFFGSAGVYIGCEDNANWKGRNMLLKVYSIRFIPR